MKYKPNFVIVILCATKQEIYFSLNKSATKSFWNFQYFDNI